MMTYFPPLEPPLLDRMRSTAEGERRCVQGGGQSDLLDEGADEIERLNKIISNLTATADWQTVPKEPTEEMLKAGFEEAKFEQLDRPGELLRTAYKAMLAAAPNESNVA